MFLYGIIFTSLYSLNPPGDFGFSASSSSPEPSTLSKNFCTTPFLLPRLYFRFDSRQGFRDLVDCLSRLDAFTNSLTMLRLGFGWTWSSCIIDGKRPFGRGRLKDNLSNNRHRTRTIRIRVFRRVVQCVREVIRVLRVAQVTPSLIRTDKASQFRRIKSGAVVVKARAFVARLPLKSLPPRALVAAAGNSPQG